MVRTRMDFVFKRNKEIFLQPSLIIRQQLNRLYMKTDTPLLIYTNKQRFSPVLIWGGARDGAVVRALASLQWGLGSTPGVDAICGLSLLSVLSLAPRGFSPGTPVFPSPQKPTLPNSNSIWNARTRLNEFIWTPRCLMDKQVIFF